MSGATTFDPWSATEAEARALALLSGDDPLVLSLVRGRGALLALQLLPPASPLARWCAATRLLDRRSAILAADGRAVMDAMDLCAQHQLVAPPWLVATFRRCLQPVLCGHVESWDSDQALGDPAPGRGGAAAAAMHRRLVCRVWAIARRFLWAQRAHGLPASDLWQCFSSSSRAAGPVSKLDHELQCAIRTAGCGRTKALDLMAEAEELLGPPAWSPRHVAPPLL
jgi:hypothetical protein